MPSACRASATFTTALPSVGTGVGANVTASIVGASSTPTPVTVKGSGTEYDASQGLMALGLCFLIVPWIINISWECSAATCRRYFIFLGQEVETPAACSTGSSVPNSITSTPVRLSGIAGT